MNNDLVPQPSWWSRNWLWVVPLGGCISLIVIFIIFMGSVVYGVTSIFKEAQPYEYALQKINEDKAITNELGSPIKKDGFISTDYKYNNGKKMTKLSLPVSGPKGSGILYIEASADSENHDHWIYDVIRIEIKDHENIEVLETELEDF